MDFSLTAPPCISYPITLSVPSGAEFLMHMWGKDFRVIDTTTQMETNSSSLFIGTASFEVASVVNMARR